MSTIEKIKTVKEVRPVTTREVLHRAADLLEEFGWCQGDMLQDAQGAATCSHPSDAWRFCAGGAVLRALYDLKVRDDFPNAVFGCGKPTWWETQLGVDVPLGVWNDRPERTKAEVVARLREAAERA